LQNTSTVTACFQEIFLMMLFRVCCHMLSRASVNEL
jgi:hypothetical protein